MHFLTIFFWSALAVQSVSADPLLYEFFSRLNSGLKTMTSDFGSLARNSFEFAGNTFTTFLDFMHSVFVGNVQIGVVIGKSLTQGAEGVAIAVLDSLQNFTIAFDSVITEQYYNIKSVIMKHVLNRVHIALDQIQEAVKSLLEVAKTKSNEVNETLAELRDNFDDQLNEWKEEQLQKVENEIESIQLEAKKIIDNFIEAKTKEFETCIAVISNKTDDLYNKAIETINYYSPTINELVYKYENCSQIPSEEAKELSQCASEVRKLLRNIRGLSYQLYSLKRQFDKMIIDDVSDKCLLINFDVGNMIDKLLSDNKSNSDNSDNADNSADSDNSNNSANSDNSANSNNSDNSADTDNSNNSANSDNSANSNNSADSDNSNNSTNSDNSANSDISANSDNSANANNSADSDNSTNSDNSANSDISANSANFQNSTNSDNSANSENGTATE